MLRESFLWIFFHVSDFFPILLFPSLILVNGKTRCIKSSPGRFRSGSEKDFDSKVKILVQWHSYCVDSFPRCKAEFQDAVYFPYLNFSSSRLEKKCLHENIKQVSICRPVLKTEINSGRIKIHFALSYVNTNEKMNRSSLDRNSPYFSSQPENFHVNALIVKNYAHVSFVSPSENNQS